jgi:hypothetical protein
MKSNFLFRRLRQDSEFLVQQKYTKINLGFHFYLAVPASGQGFAGSDA